MGRMIAHVAARESFMANLSFWLNLIVSFVLHEKAISRTTGPKKKDTLQKNEDRTVGKGYITVLVVIHQKTKKSWYTYAIANSELTLNNSQYCIGYEYTQDILKKNWI